jgi:hypothetical protein
MRPDEDGAAAITKCANRVVLLAVHMLLPARVHSHLHVCEWLPFLLRGLRHIVEQLSGCTRSLMSRNK